MSNFVNYTVYSFVHATLCSLLQCIDNVVTFFLCQICASHFCFCNGSLLPWFYIISCLIVLAIVLLSLYKVKRHILSFQVFIMKMLEHPNIVNLIEVIDDPESDRFYMGTDVSLCLLFWD